MSFLLNLDSSTATNIVNNQTDDFTITFNTPLNMVGYWEVALIKSNLYYSWYNISSEKGNNVFRYFNGSVYSSNITIPDGQYSIDQLNDFVHNVMKDNGDFTLVGTTYVYDISLYPNYSTGRVRVELTNGYKLDLQLSTLNLLLGFDPIEVTTTSEGTELANINDDINNILIHCDIIEPSASYNNSISNDIIYSFVPDSIPGTNINIEPRTPIYIPVYTIGNKLKQIRIYLTDNLQRRLNLNGEPFTTLLHFKMTQPIF